MRQNRIITEKKYVAFIDECYQKKTFDLKQLLQKHKVDASLISTLSAIKLVVLVGNGIYNWVGNTPTQSDIETIVRLHRERAKTYRENRDKRREEERETEKKIVSSITEEQAVALLKSLGTYEIYKVERKQL